MGVGKEVAQSEFPENIVMAGFVAAFGEPEAPGPLAEYLPEKLHPYRYLGPNYLVLQADEWQVAVGGAAGNEFHPSCVQQLAEGIEEVAAVLIKDGPVNLLVPLLVQLRGVVEFGHVAGSFHFQSRQFHQAFQVLPVFFHDQFVPQHADKRGAEGDGDAEVDIVSRQFFQHLKDGDVGFGYPLIEPPFLQVFLTFGVADVREMGMQYQAYQSFFHANLPFCT